MNTEKESVPYVGFCLSTECVYAATLSLAENDVMNAIGALNDLNYHHTLMDTTGIALVYFTAPDCGTCRSLALALQQYAENSPDVKIFAVDAVHNGGLINEFEIFHLPTLFMYFDGVFHADLQCMALPDAIREVVKNAAALPAEDEP